MWEQMKWAMAESARKVCNVWLSTSRRWEPKKCWKEMLGARNEDAKERCLEVYKEEKRKVKKCIYQSKEEVQKQFGRKMNQDVNGNRKLFWKEVSKANGGNVENNNKINGRLVLEEAEVQKIWKEYYENLYNINIQEQVAVHLCGFDGVCRGNYFRGKTIRRTEVEVRVGKLRNGNAAGKDEVTGEMIKSGGKRMVDWIWWMCNMAFESGNVLED